MTDPAPPTAEPLARWAAETLAELRYYRRAGHVSPWAFDCCCRFIVCLELDGLHVPDLDCRDPDAVRLVWHAPSLTVAVVPSPSDRLICGNMVVMSGEFVVVDEPFGPLVPECRRWLSAAFLGEE